MTTSTRLAATLTCAALTLALTAAPVEAAPTWRPVDTVSVPGANAYETDLATDDSGTVVAVWRRYDGAQYVVQASVRPPGGGWSAPVDLSAPGEDATKPQVAVDAAGNAVAVWVRFNGTNEVVQASTRAATGGWTPAVDLSAGTQPADYPQVAMNAAGAAVAVWHRYDGDDYRVQASSRPPGGGWSGPADLSADGQDAVDPQVGIDDSGRATAIWSRYDGLNYRIQASIRTPAGVWGLADDLTPEGTYSHEARLAVDGAGHAVAGWRQNRGPLDVIQASVQAVSGTWSAAVDLSPTTATSYDAQVAIDPAGNATATWRFAVGMGFEVQASSRPAGGTWSPRVTLSDPDNTADFDLVTMAPDGTATAAWLQYTGSLFVVKASRRALGGTWSPAVTLSDTGATAGYPALAVDPAGDVTAAWGYRDGGTFVIKAAGLDVAGPVVTGFVVPAGATAGTAATFSASAVDTWSPVASYAWSFGDGGTASGANVTHTYATLGSHPVTLTVTDAVGNTSTRTATTLAAAPVPAITTFKLKKKTIATDEKTKLKVRLNTAATLKLVFKSKHKHVVKGKKKYVRVVLRKQLPAGLSKITIKAKIKGKTLKPDTYVIKGSAKNTSGTSPKQKAKLKVVR